MATETISVRERIQRVFLGLVAGVAGIGTVYRWDMRGLRDPQTGLGVDATGARLALKDLDAVVMAGDETAEDGGEGDIGYTVNTLPMQVHLKLAQSDNDPLGTERMVNRWLYLLEKAVMANRRMIEPAGAGNAETLAVDTHVTARGMGDTVPGQRELLVGIAFETSYETSSADPATGPGITAYEEGVTL